jgi:hypothetical protein
MTISVISLFPYIRRGRAKVGVTFVLSYHRIFPSFNLSKDIPPELAAYA